MVSAAKMPDSSEFCMSSVISGVSTQVAMAPTRTTRNAMAVLWTTESMVIRRAGPAYVGESGEPGVPVPQVEGSP